MTDYSQQINQYQNLQNQMNQLGQLLNAQPAMQPAKPKRNIDYVDGGIEGARTFLEKEIGPNESAVVFDRQAAQFYSLSKDANGVPAKIKIGTFTLEDEPSPEDKYVTKEQFKEWADRIEGLLRKEKQE